MLIKLTGVPHPDLNGGKPQPIYIDASRVLFISQGHCQWPKLAAIDKHRELYDKLYLATCELGEKVGNYIPNMNDPVAVGWMKTAQVAAGAVSIAYRDFAAANNQNMMHPRMDCTEVQLACGTALEHGVMLTRVWVSESPEEVMAAIEKGLAA